jgi:DNA adenine methylase
MPKRNSPKEPLPTIVQPLKWHGGKGDLADWIISLMPPRCKTPNAPKPDDDGWLHYVEPYAGGLAVLLAMDPEGISEVVNDLNGELTNFWQCLQSVDTFRDFKRVVESVPFSEAEFQAAMKMEIFGSDTDRAVNFFIKCRQSLAGRMKGFTGITRTRIRRGMNSEVAAWLNCIEGLQLVHARLKRVLIRNQPALDVIRKEDGHRTLHYIDPPYLHSTRATTNEYAHEMTVDDHEELLHALDRIKGRFLLSGYHSPLYDHHAKQLGWTCHEKQINNHAAGGKTKRVMTECLWCNF